jgi:hypothetical protein
MSREYLIEILELVNKEPEKLVEFKGNNALKALFEHAFLPEKKFELPEGVPPYKEDSAPIGMNPSNFTQEMRKLYIFTKAQPLNQIRRESLFIQLLEGVHPSEAKVLCAVKDQTLHKMYKKITPELVAQHGFIPEVVKEKKNGKPG